MFTPDIDYAELFGVELSEEPEVAEPEHEEEPEGAEEPGVTEEDDNAEPDEIDGGGEETPPEPEQKPKQSAEENARFAAARRKAEQERDAAIATARRDMQQQMDAMIAGLGLKNPETGEAIRTKQQYDNYRAQTAKQEREKLMKRSGMDEGQWNEFVQNLPEVAEANRARQQANQAMQMARRERAKQAIEADVAAISQMDPNIRTLEDLSKTQEFAAIQKRVQGGMTLLDAYRLETWDKQMRARNAAAEQAAVNKQKSKDHLRKTTERGKGDEPVPSDVLQMYRDMMPGITDAEIRKHWNRKR